jgi:hypothetical protein
MHNQLNAEFFRALVPFEACNARVVDRLHALRGNEQLLRFFARYACWNGRFANGVSALTALIGDAHELFVEAGMPRAVADRSNFIASHFFDAARDEYDDHINAERDSHRCMAQASLLAMADLLGTGSAVLDEATPASLQTLHDDVRAGYTGLPAQSVGAAGRLFYGMGFHVGSELLADREFSIIDSFLRDRHAALVQQLMRRKVRLAGAEHRTYAWIGIHSGHGGGVEADHFDHAVNGVRQALRYQAPPLHDDAMQRLQDGFRGFAEHHRAFFALAPTSD